MVNDTRVRQINSHPAQKGPIVYWMQREHRVEDNWALLYAQELAIKQNTHVLVAFSLRATFPHATERLIDFMLRGLSEVETSLRLLHIPFTFLIGDPTEQIPKFALHHKAGAVITEFHSLKIERQWREKIADKVSAPMYEVDTRNIVPCWIASSKQEYGAYTLRPKIHRLLPVYLEEIPSLKKQVFTDLPGATDWKSVRKQITYDTSVAKLDWITPGEKAARVMLKEFIEDRLFSYNEDRNNPCKNGQSGLSPYLHFGHIASQRVVLEIQKHKNNQKSEEAFIEEITVRRELSDNYCYYNDHYDSPKGYPTWAQESLGEHLEDTRAYTYTLSQLEKSQTHDELWNAAQLQAVKTGKMHGYMRMYWAKKILEWSNAPAEAQKNAIFLMDRYFIDGRESNGFTGIAWSMGGVHDRAWFDREIFGKVRYMSYNGAKSKFDIEAYITRVKSETG